MEIFVPGRLCLFGEHSDWAGAWRPKYADAQVGHCLVTGTEQGILAEARALADEIFAMSVPGPDGPRELSVRLDKPNELAAVVEEKGFFSYAAGVAAEVRDSQRPRGGLELRVLLADLPIRKGLSSSAAACVLVARAFNRVHGLGLSLEAEMDLAYRGERRAGSSCGRMDQVCALGMSSSFLSFDGEDMRIESVAPGGPLHLLIVDLKGSKDTRRILSDLQGCFPATPGQVAANVREALGPRNAALVHHARTLLEAGDAPALGELMSEAQELFDRLVAPACPELEAPRLHALLASSEVRELAWGGKGVGSQGDGCAQLVAKGPDESDELRRRLEAHHGLPSLPKSVPIGDSPQWGLSPKGYGLRSMRTSVSIGGRGAESSSRLPSGQRMLTESSWVSVPRPKCTRGSELAW